MEMFLIGVILLSALIAIITVGESDTLLGIISTVVGIVCIWFLIILSSQPYKVKKVEVRLTHNKQIELDGTVFHFDNKKKVIITTKNRGYGSTSIKKEYRIEDYE